MNKSELKPALVFEQFAKINEITSSFQARGEHD